MDDVLASRPTDELTEAIDQVHALKQAVHLHLLRIIAATDRRKGWEVDGAFSMADWLSARLGLGQKTAREWVRVAHSLEILPMIANAFGEGLLSFDQIQALTRFVIQQDDGF
jgi:hypothetical protein